MALRVGIAFYLLYICGLLFPNVWWGTHCIAFLPAGLQYGLLIAAGGLIATAALKQSPFDRTFNWPMKGRPWLLPALLAAAFGILYYNFPIAHDGYGDAERWMMALEQGDASNNYWAFFFDPNVFSGKNGERTILALVEGMNKDLKIEYAQAFRILGLLSGMVFVCCWTAFVQWLTEGGMRRAVLIAAGLLAPATWMFFGHQEIYAPGFAAITATLISMVLYFRTGSRKWFWATIVLTFLSIKLHSAAFLLLPGLGLVLAWQLGVRKLFTGRKLGLIVLAPILMLGAVIYFVFLGDHNDPRFLQADLPVYERMFLPIVAPEPPLDRYTVLSPAHLLDYLNVILLWCPAMLVLLAHTVIGQRKAVNWKDPALLVTGFLLVLMTLFFFMVNPLLGMQIDVDLFTLPAPMLLVFAAVVVSAVPVASFDRRIVGPALGIALLSLPLFIVNASPAPLSQRYEALGVSAFHGYWIRSAATIASGLEMAEETEYIRRYEALAEQLEPAALPGKDIEYADILMRIGRYYRRAKRDYPKAVAWHGKAYTYSPLHKGNLVGLMESHFLLGQFDKAHDRALELIDLGYPSPEKALSIALHTALEAGRYGPALDHANTYVRNWPGNERIQYVREQLQAGTNLEELKKVFSGG